MSLKYHFFNISVSSVNWDIQHQVWDYVFGNKCLNVDFGHTGVILTEPHFNFRSIQDITNEVLFEDYQFASAFRINGMGHACAIFTSFVLSL